jgi:hypothetical protein
MELCVSRILSFFFSLRFIPVLLLSAFLFERPSNAQEPAHPSENQVDRLVEILTLGRPVNQNVCFTGEVRLQKGEAYTGPMIDCTLSISHAPGVRPILSARMGQSHLKIVLPEGEQDQNEVTVYGSLPRRFRAFEFPQNPATMMARTNVQNPRWVQISEEILGSMEDEASVLFSKQLRVRTRAVDSFDHLPAEAKEVVESFFIFGSAKVPEEEGRVIPWSCQNLKHDPSGRSCQKDVEDVRDGKIDPPALVSAARNRQEIVRSVFRHPNDSFRENRAKSRRKDRETFEVVPVTGLN